MFQINSITVPPGKVATIAQVTPNKTTLKLGDTMGPQGAQYEVTIPGMGIIRIVDIGNTVKGPATWAVQLNGNVNWFYEGGGQMSIDVGKTGIITVTGGAGKVQTNLLIQGPSITVDQNWGTYPPYGNPNVYPGDTNGNPVAPQHGVACHLWANVENNGTEDAQAVTASFFIAIPTTNVLWPAAAHGSNSIPSLASGASQKIMCSIPWIPDSTTATHQCIVGVASCLDCAAPPTVPGTPVPYDGVGRDQQVGLHNVILTIVANKSASTIRHFNVLNAQSDGYVQIIREPLEKNASTLASKGIDPAFPEAPQGEQINIVRSSDGKVLGDRMDFKKGESHELHTTVVPTTHQSGTAAIYHVQHFENGKIVGGVSQIIVHQ